MAEIRAKRRFLELQNRGQEVNMPALIADIEKRDLKDSSRELSPLLPAEDAHIIDSLLAIAIFLEYFIIFNVGSKPLIPIIELIV